MNTGMVGPGKMLRLYLLAAAAVFFFIAQSPAQGAVAAPRQAPSHESLLKKEMPKILPVLEEKMGNKKLVEKSKEKLSGMGDREIRLISALCERIPLDDSSVSGDIAFFLVSALIVLS